ncbi:MAG: DUF2892 domain-containing protein [Brumimicrobium sp.]|nr:DUF2892 domain-containing protein [Brumimicrobium sp.]
MNPNLSNTDRAVRFLLFISAIILFILDIIQGWLAYGLILVGTVFLTTSLMSFCPIYRFFGLSSRKREIRQ